MEKRYRRDKRDEALPSHYSLSVIVPAYNEVDNIEPLAREFEDFLSRQRFRAEVIVVDDGSTDGTGDRVLELSRRYDFLKLVRHKQNLGKTAAIETGFSASKGKRIAIFDADLQYDPQDLKRMMDKLDRGYGIVSGVKQGKYQKPFVSKIFNGLTRRLFGIKVKDMNSLKMLRREVMAELFLRKDWHRFMVVLAAERGYRVASIPVTLRPRRFGEPKYNGFGRVFVGVTDLIAVWLSERVFRKPMLYFGSAGLIALLLSVMLALFILIARLGWDWGYPPLQTLLILTMSLAGFSFTLGFLAEAIANLRDRVEFLMSKGSKLESPQIETDRRRERRPVRSQKSEPKQNRPKTSEGPVRKEVPPPKKHEKQPTKKSPERDKKQAPKKIEKHPPKKSRETQPKPKPVATEKATEQKNIADSFEFVPREKSWGRRGHKKHTNIVKIEGEEESLEKAKKIAKEIDSEAFIGYEKKGSDDDEK